MIIASCGHTLSPTEGLGTPVTYPVDEYEILSGCYCRACAESLRDVAMTPEQVEEWWMRRPMDDR